MTMSSCDVTGLQLVIMTKDLGHFWLGSYKHTVRELRLATFVFFNATVVD